jgi:hypothetical protein
VIRSRRPVTAGGRPGLAAPLRSLRSAGLGGRRRRFSRAIRGFARGAPDRHCLERKIALPPLAPLDRVRYSASRCSRSPPCTKPAGQPPKKRAFSLSCHNRVTK